MTSVVYVCVASACRTGAVIGRRIALLILLVLSSLPAATVTWTGGGTTNNWSDAGNWGGTAPVAGDDLVFAGVTRLTNTNDIAANTSFNSITFSLGAGSFVISGNAITIAGGASALINNASANTMSISNALTFSSAAPTITVVGGGTLTLSGTFNNGGFFVTTAVSGTLNLNGVVSGNGGLTKTAGGVLRFGAVHTYGGATTVSAGTLRLGIANAIPSGANKGDVALNGTLDLNAFSVGVNGLTGSGTVTTASGVGTYTLTVGNNNVSSTFAGVIQNGTGTVALTKTGTGTLTLSGTHTYSGATTINSTGVLRVTGTIAAGSAVSVGTGTTLEGTGTVAGTVTVAGSGAISPGTGGTNIGTLTTGAVTYSATTMVTRVDLDGTTPTTDLIASSGTVTLASSTLTINSITSGLKGRVYTIITASSVTGTFNGLADGAITVANGRAFRVNYTATTVTLTDLSAVWDGGGTDNLWTTAANWVGDVVPVAGDAIIFAGTTRLAPVNDFTAGTSFYSLTFAVGAGNFVLSGNDVVFSGGTNALIGSNTAGTMTVGNNVTFSTAAPTMSIATGGTLVFTGTIDNGGLLLTASVTGTMTVNGVIVGTGGLTKTQGGTLTLAGVNTYTGATTLTTGTLRVTGSTVAASTVAVGTGTTLEGTGTVAGAVTVSGNGIVSPGTGGTTIATLTTGAVTYAGATGVMRVDLDGTTPLCDLISSTGTVTLANNVLTINNLNNPLKGRVYTIINAASVTGTFAGLADGATLMTVGRGFRVNYTATTVTLTDIAAVWDGGGIDNRWTTAANWVGDVAPVAGDAVIFAGGTRLVSSNDFTAGTAFASITFSAGAGDFVLGGNALTLTAGSTALMSNATTGTMTIGNALTFSTLAPTITTTASGALVFNGTIDSGTLLLTVAAAGPVTMNGVVSGSGGLTKTQAATLTLAAVNTYTGATTLSTGTLRVTGSTAVGSAVSVAGNAILEGSGSVLGATSVAATGILSPGIGGSTIATLTTANVTHAAATSITRIDLDGTAPSADRITSSGTVALAGSILTINSVTNLSRGQVFTIVSGASITGTFAGLANNATFMAGNRGFRINYVGGAPVTSVTLTDISAIWDGGGTDDLWTTAANWVGDVVPATNDALIFSGNTRLTPSNDVVGGTYTSITFVDGAGNFVLGGNGVTLIGGATAVVSNATSGTMTINQPLTFSTSAPTITSAAGGTLNVGGAIANGGLLTTFAAGGPITVSGVISGTAGFTKTSTAIVTLSAANTYNGTTTISSGTLLMGLANALPNGAGKGDVSVGGTLDLGGFATAINGLTGGGSVTSTNPATLTLGNGAASATFTGSITGAVALTKVGGAIIQTISGINTYTGATTVSAGTLRMGVANSLPAGGGKSDVSVTGILDLGGFATAINGLSGSGTITNSSGTTCTLTIGYANGAGTFSGVIQNGGGAVSLTKTGGGTQTLSGDNTYTGATAITAGSMRITGSLSSSSAVTVNGGTLEGTGTVGGPVTLTSGSIAPGNGGSAISTLTTGAVTCAAGGALSVDLNGAGPTSDLLSCTGAVALNGSLNVTSSSNFTPGGVYTIVSGTSVSGTFSGLANGAVLVSGGRAFTVNYTATTVTLTATTTAEWDGGGSDDLWSTAANWVGDVVPTAGANLIFAGSTRLTPNNDLTGLTFASLSFAPGAGNFAISGNTITLTGGTTALSSGATSGTMTVTAPVVFSTAAATISTVAGGTLSVGDIANGGALLTITNAGPVTLTGAVTGTGGLTKLSGGSLTMSGLSATPASNFTGALSVDAGSLTITTTNPSLSGALFFGATAGSANVVTLDLSAASLTTGAFTVRTDSASANLITIGNGRTLTTGSVTIGTAITGTNTALTVSGAGAWVVNAPAGQFWLGAYNPVVTNFSNQASLDLSGLATFTCDVTTGSMLLGRFGDNSARSGFMNLATNSTISAATLTIGESSSVTTMYVRMGSGATLLQVDTLNIGTGGRDSGSLSFASGSGTLQLRNRAGTGRANVNIQTGGSIQTGYLTVNTLDLAGHTVDLLVNDFLVGGQGRSGAATNTITFSNGTFDVTTIRLGERSNTTATASTHASTLSISGGNVTIGTGGLQLANNTATGGTANALNATVNISGGTVTIANNATIGAAIRLANNSAASGGTTANGVLNLTGGTLTVAGNIILGATTRPATAALTLAGGTLNMAGGSIGSATATVTFAPQSGSLTNLSELNGGGAFTKTTAGTLTLGGTNTWSGTTTISAGTVLLAAANTLPSGAGKGDITIVGTLDLGGFTTSLNGLSGSGVITSSVAGACTLTIGNNDGSGTWSGVIQNGSGTVALTKNGLGTQVLSAANTYSGATNLTAGTLRVSGSTSAVSALTVTGGTLEGAGTVAGSITMTNGTVAPGNGGSAVGTLSTGSVTCTSNNALVLNLDGSSLLGERILSSGSVALDGTLTVASNANGTAGAVYTIVSAASISGTFTGLPDGTIFAGSGHAYLITYSATAVTLTDASSVWDGGGADDLWSNPLNWVGDAVPVAGARLVFAGSTRLTPNNDLTGISFSSLGFAEGAGNFVISGNPITLTAGTNALMSGATSGTMTISAPIVFAAAAPSIVTAAGGTLVLSGLVDNAGMALAITNAGPMTISGDVIGSGSLTKTGAATLTMSGAGSYSGGTLLAQGDLVLASSGGAMTGPVGTGALTIASGTNAARVLLTGGQTVSNALVMTSITPGAALAALQQTGAGLATWSGTITLNANPASGGHLAGGASAANALVVSGQLTSGGSLTRAVQRSGVVIYGGTSGTLPELGITGTAQWAVNDPLPAAVQLFLSTGTASGETGTVDLNGFNQTIAGLTFQNAGGGLVTTGAGTLTLAGDLTASFTGTLDADVNQISGNLNLGGGTRTMTVANSSAAVDVGIGAVISNGGLTKAGTGTMMLYGPSANTHTTTTVSAGIMHLSKTPGVDAIAGTLAITGGVVTFGANHQIADAATVTMSGTTSVFNGTAANTGALSNFNETFAALTVTGGAFNCGTAATTPVITVTGAANFTGGAGNTIFIAQSGTIFTAGSLAITSMTAVPGGTVATNNSFTLYGNSTTMLSTIRTNTVTLNGGRINLRRGGAGALGSRLVIDGDVTTVSAASFITEDTNGGTTGTLALELSSAAGAVVRTFSLGAALDINAAITNGAATTADLTKTGVGQLTLGGGTLANTYNGLTTVSAGRMHLNKSATTIAIPGDLVINGGQVSLVNNSPSNQISDATNVTMSGTASVFNGTAGVNVGVANVTETIASLVMSGGNFNFGGTSVWTITGQFGVTGGGNTIVVGNSGSRLSAGSLSLSAMSARAAGVVATNDSFTMYGASSTQQSILTVGAGGLILDNSTLYLRYSTVVGNLGSKLVLNGDISSVGTLPTGIAIDTSGGTNGTVALELSGIAGVVARTISTAAGGADLTIGVPITNGLATPASITKTGSGALTTTATNTWTGTTSVTQGALYLVGTQATSAVTVDAGTTFGGSGTIPGPVALSGTLAPGSGGSTTGQLSTGATTWNSGVAMVVDLNGTGPAVDSITTAGQPIALDGPLTINSLINATAGQVFTIVSASSITGTFTNAATEGALLPVGAGGQAMSVSYATPGVVTLTCQARPTVTAIAPDNGPTSAQTPVIITGTLFDPAATVLIGGNPATGVTWVSSTQIDAVTPTGTQGLADVTVINPGSSSGTLVGGYAYTGPLPTITAISPPNGPAMTTTAVTITGSNFCAGTPLAVSVGGIAATAVTYVNATTITATFPAMSASAIDATPDVVITNGDRQQGTLANGFSYDMAPIDDATGAIAGLAYRYHQVGGPLLPTFSSLVPNRHGNRANPTLNANPIEVRNDNWSMEFSGYVTAPTDGIYTFYTASDDGSRLYIDTTLVVNNNFQQGTTERSGQIALAAGTHRLRVEYAQGNGGSTLAARWQGPTFTKTDIQNGDYSCDPTPVITTVSPSAGPQGGGTTVTITGSNFVAGSLVAIGGVLGVSPIVVDANTITVTTPGGTVGTKDVLVIGPRSAGVTAVGAFTYSSSPAPTLTAISPANGTALGGTTVTLTVSNVPVAPTVTFNGVAATSVVWVDATTVTCVTPAMPLADTTADVTVTVGGQSATMLDGYTWDSFRTPENPSGTQAGLAYRYYRVGGPTLPTFSSLTPFSTGVAGSTPTPTVFGWTANPIEPGYLTNFSLRYVGYLTVPATGVYTLYTASDDGSRLYIGTTLVVENNFAQGVTERSGVIALTAGTHLMTVEFAQGTGGFGMYVRWLGPALAKADIPNSAFTTDPTPSISGLDVTTGPQSGGTPIVITGSGFTSGATVTIGGTAANNVVVGATTITCTTPSHATGVVPVVVTNPTGLSATYNSFTYTASSGPTITSINPTSGPSDGGTTVTITGSNFVAPMSVTFGGVAATNVTVQSTTSLQVTSPAMQGSVLTVDVVVTNGSSQSATLTSAFTYTLRTPENPTNTQPGLTWRYHRVVGAGSTIPNFTGLTPYAIGVRSNAYIAQGSPGAANPFDAGYNLNWSVEYYGYLTVPQDDVYTFFTLGDDHSQILFGNGVVLTNTTANVESAGRSIGLRAGTHRITIRMSQGTGNFLLNVRWQSNTFGKQAIPDSAFSTDATPTIATVSPNVGPIAGGTALSITGTGFTTGTSVSLGGTAATNVVVAGDGLSLTATTPSHALGPVAVTVQNGFGMSTTLTNGFTYQGSTPVITAVSPTVGPTAGGTAIQIYGSNFAAGATVLVGGVAATNVVVGSGVISARTPAGTQGPVVVTVTNIDGLSGTRSPGFYYQGPAPTITTVTPANGPMAGGTVVQIQGTNFTTGATVTFDGVAVASTTVNSSTLITVSTAAGAQGPADIVVTNNDLRTVTRTNGFIFEGPAPVVSSISPTNGPLLGGTNVTISGNNFVAGAVVRFDGVAATGVTVSNANTIQATTPAGLQGPADVTVTNVDLLADTLAASYIYLGTPPAVTGISPGAVPMNYLTTDITISGSGFAAGVQVTVQGQVATIMSVNGTTVVFRLPGSGLTAGPAPVVVTNVDLQTITYNGFVVQGPAPIITGLDVPYGPVAGGRRLTISGSAFRAGATVTFGSVPATSVTVVDAGTIVAVSPAHPEGKVTITVTNDDLLFASVVNGYAYYKRSDQSTAGNGCGTGGGLAVFLLLAFALASNGVLARRRG